MADSERSILEHYHLSTPYPVEWPADKDESDASDDEDLNEQPMRAKLSRVSRSRYSALERVASDRKSYVPGSQKTGDGVENLVQRDEPDPLGSADSVVRILRQQGLPVQDDSRLRNRFLLSSTTFSPALFLSQVHAEASTQSLLEGLDALSRSIDQKSASLKVLVESNFERFVRAKATIDNVYTEMRYRGAEPEMPQARRHSRHSSRNNNSGGSGTHAPLLFTDPQKQKNALTRESEYGVLGIKTPLLEVSAKAEEVWGPALGGREKETSLKIMSSNVVRQKQLYEVSGSISDCIKRKDYETLVKEYAKARGLADSARMIAARIKSRPPSEDEIHEILLAARIWSDVEAQIEDLRRDVWRRLVSLERNSKTEGSFHAADDQHMELIGLLLELAVTDNPISVWLLTRFDYLRNKIQATSERSRVEIEIVRRRLATGEKPSPHVIASHFRSLGHHGMEDNPMSLDSPEILEMWEKMQTFLNTMLSAQGLLGEVLEWWQTVQGFIDGTTQVSLPIGPNGVSTKHHRLSTQGTIDLQEGMVELIDMMRESIHTFFADPPIEDISSLFSPLPLTPRSPLSSAPQFPLTPSRGQDPRMTFDSNSMSAPLSKRGESWEKFAFWPPWSNSLSGVYYLAKLLVIVGTGASELATITPMGKGDGSAIERLKGLVSGARERCVTAACAAWNKDAENIKVLEDWRRSPEKRDVTRMPASFRVFESTLLSGMQKILYISEAIAKSGSADVVLPPPPKLLQMVRSQFVTTLYKALSGMVENAEKSSKQESKTWTADSDGLATPVTMALATSMGSGTVNASDRDVRMLLTLSNLLALRVTVVPSLTAQFENAFSVKLTEETKTIRDVLGQIDARLFQSFVRSSVENLRTTIRTGIASPEWEPAPSSKPKDVRPYVYESLLHLSLVHTQVSTTAATLTPQVLSYLLEQISRELLDAFKLRQKYTLASLMQATLDVEYFAQTLSQYTTDRASEMQSQIYQELDKGTDNDARTRLQGELPEMRAALKRLREGTKGEFMCFKKLRDRAGAKPRREDKEPPRI